jgi:hypothetical protein
MPRPDPPLIKHRETHRRVHTTTNGGAGRLGEFSTVAEDRQIVPHGGGGNALVMMQRGLRTWE